MTPSRKHRTGEQEDRLREAEAATESLGEQRTNVNRQLSLVDRLTEGWRRVHERNHLAQIFHEQGGL
jgi:hypothetical protein